MYTYTRQYNLRAEGPAPDLLQTVSSHSDISPQALLAASLLQRCNTTVCHNVVWQQCPALSSHSHVHGHCCSALVPLESEVVVHEVIYLPAVCIDVQHLQASSLLSPGKGKPPRSGLTAAADRNRHMVTKAPAAACLLACSRHTLLACTWRRAHDTMHVAGSRHARL